MKEVDALFSQACHLLGNLPLALEVTVDTQLIKYQIK